MFANFVLPQPIFIVILIIAQWIIVGVYLFNLNVVMTNCPTHMKFHACASTTTLVVELFKLVTL